MDKIQFNQSKSFKTKKVRREVVNILFFSLFVMFWSERPKKHKNPITSTALITIVFMIIASGEKLGAHVVKELK